MSLTIQNIQKKSKGNLRSAENILYFLKLFIVFTFLNISYAGNLNTNSKIGYGDRDLFYSYIPIT